MMKSVIAAAAAFVLVSGVTHAQLPTANDLEETAKTAGMGALSGAATAAGEVAKDPGHAKKHIGGSAKTIAIGGAKGAGTAITTKKTVKTTTTTTTVSTQPAGPKKTPPNTPATAAPTPSRAPPN